MTTLLPTDIIAALLLASRFFHQALLSALLLVGMERRFFLSRRILFGDQGMLMWWSIEAGVHVEPHSHTNEQIVWMLQGKMEFRPNSGSVALATSWSFQQVRSTRHGSGKTPR